MNKTYRSIWSEADQTWVAAPETAAARGKSVRRLAVLATSAIGLAASFAPSTGFATTKTPAPAPTPGIVGQGGLELCAGAKGYAWGYSGGSQSIDCSVDGKGTTDGLAFSLNNTADSKGGYGFGGSTAQVAGYQNGTLNLKGASVMVYGPTTFDSIVTMSNKKIVQLAPGLVSAASTEAINGSQLYATNENVSDLQSQVVDAVMYDTSAHDALTLGGTNATTPVALHNVAAGDLSPASTDAVNGSQLYATNANVSDLQGEVAHAVMYDTSAHDTLTLGGANATTPVALHNVAAGDLSPASTDAVNGSQLYATNANVSDLQGQVADAIMYDTSAHDAVTLGGANATTPVALHNVAAGDLSPASTDAINGSQLYATNQSITSLAGEVAGAVMYDAPAHDTVTLGGASATTPVALRNIAAGDLSSASTDAINGSQLYATNQSITNLQGEVAHAVMYDTSAHDTLTLGGPYATGPVGVYNVKDGELSPGSTHAVNGSQLYSVNQAVINNTTEITNLTENIYNGTIGVVKQDAATRDITVGRDTDGTLVDLTGTSGARRLTGLAAGTGADDAVNVAQMQSAGFQFDSAGIVLNEAVTYTAGSIASGSPVITLAAGNGDSPYYRDPNDRTQGFLPAGTLIRNVADGLLDTDAVNLGQVNDLIGKATEDGSKGGAIVLAARNLAASGTGSGVDSSQLTKSYATAAYYSQVAGRGDSAGSVGPSDKARAEGAGSIAIGSNAYTAGVNGVAVGVQAYTPANDAVALGSGSVANEDNTVSVGNDSTSSYTALDANGQPYTIAQQANTRRIVNMAAGQNSNDAVNVWQLNQALSAIGGGAAVNADGSIKTPTFSVGGTTVSSVGAALANLDTRVSQNTADIASIGASAGTSALTSTDADAVHYDSSAHDTITFGDVKMTGLQNATLSASSTDAVTGQQLYATNQQLANLGQSVQNIAATGTSAISTNSTSGPAAAAGAQSVAVGGGAVATGDYATAIGDSANASAANSVAIGANSIANRDNAVSVGQEGAERQVVNVAAGTSGTDAVNVNQLNSTVAQQTTAINQQISGLQRSIDTVQKNAYAGVAAAMAMPNLTPSGPGRTVVAAGGGYYKGSSAAAVGVTYRSTNTRWLVNGAFAVTNNGDAGARAQIGYEF